MKIEQYLKRIEEIAESVLDLQDESSSNYSTHICNDKSQGNCNYTKLLEQTAAIRKELEAKIDSYNPIVYLADGVACRPNLRIKNNSDKECNICSNIYTSVSKAVVKFKDDLQGNLIICNLCKKMITSQESTI